ncbi:D-alanyl-D-alanine carboxypeptidase [Ornithinibacillus gellani]|uniref:D-alanyl-D-alanine carboxypeptidase family protein n=1 Tax=Ornithinibacillus gellani TaxID=2293253 RepID=UPI000F49E515|nr:D-alanyl-D-alanine carboxypeptidase family protein [Ornithinibacillus gellani]TQS74451.1 D-alanyl-D-alanine carboxypeptidase [Ornithinibacillus gellani]
MHKRIIAFVLICLLVIAAQPLQPQAAPAVSAQQAVLLDAKSGRVLYEKAAHEKRPIASITKIMTAILAIESGKMDDMVTTSRKAIYTEGSSIYLEQGEKMKLEDLIYGLMLRSGNDAAIAISEHVAGSEEGFVYLMNEKARWLGMTNTSFANPHGLDEENHYSTAYDMALLMQYAMQNKVFSKVSNTEMYRAKTRSYSWLNKNKLLTSYYKYCTGGKTGFTKISGRTLVSTAHVDGKDLIAVTLRAPDDWNDHIQLFEYGFQTLEDQALEEKGQTSASPSKDTQLDSKNQIHTWREVILEVMSKITGVDLPWSI